MNGALRNAIAEELDVDPEELTSDKVLEDFETWDSVVVLTIMIILSDDLGLSVTPEEVKNLKTFGDIEKLVVSKRKE